MRLLTELQFCPTSSNLRNPKLKPIGDGFGFLLLLDKVQTLSFENLP